MIELTGVTAQAVKLALDVSILRHQVIANNIANVDTPGFVPKRVSFEDQLRSIESSLLSGRSDSALSAELDRVADRLGSNSIVDDGDETVQIDLEMVKLADNTVRYQTLINALSNRGTILRTAITGGRS
ncbi:flagellar basal body rod protein FlgB [Myxococcota bacterium]|nr:flagellar basal body rod protein FlgB [Myxococcota bacterium]